MAETEAFITLKDHKDNFESNPKCRLINSAKSELGKVSKIILDCINQEIRSSTNVKRESEFFQTVNLIRTAGGFKINMLETPCQKHIVFVVTWYVVF